MKRHGFGGGPRTHGQSDRARAPGFIGGYNSRKSVQGPKNVRPQRGRANYCEKSPCSENRHRTNLLWLKGAVPGSPNGLVTIRKTGKTAKSSN
ncbi:MAG: hypothetical protein CM1200mP15_11660 [Dehalococcoidia bacterium]|nr:MAG: hypothetical protein CM1200mP15_11660 [Dehalococcoidia bacterium]